MSIIYDALKKVTKTSPQASGPDSTGDSKQSRFIYLKYILVVVLGFFIAKVGFNVFIDKPKVKTTEQKVAYQPAPVQKAKPALPISKETGEPKEQVVELFAEEEEQQQESRVLVKLNLSGIFFDQQRSYALINNKIVEEGSVVKGVKVVRILPQHVELEFEGKPLVLRMSR